jgi:hypothetical protein
MHGRLAAGMSAYFEIQTIGDIYYFTRPYTLMLR